MDRLRPVGAGTLLRHMVAGGFFVMVLTTAFIAPASAHGWQNTTTAGEYRLGIHTDPANPVADTDTEFLGRIRNTSAADGTSHASGATNETGVANRTVAIIVTGPNGSCDRLTATMPENDSHFAFSYRFPTAGTYDITARTTIEGKQVAFRTKQRVAASATVAEDTSRTETTDASNAQPTETAGASTAQPTETGSGHDGLGWKLTTIQLLSGASMVLAGGALWAAVLAYRGTD